VFVRQSIEAVGHTFVEALILVVLVVLIFLQTWRAFDYSAVGATGYRSWVRLHHAGAGIYAEHALAVLDWCWRSGSWWTTRLWWWKTSNATWSWFAAAEATQRAMAEVSGPIIAIALVLCACSCQRRLSVGLSGQFYKQFALTIAISTVISAFNLAEFGPAAGGRCFCSRATRRKTGFAGAGLCIWNVLPRFNKFFAWRREVRTFVGTRFVRRGSRW